MLINRCTFFCAHLHSQQLQLPSLPTPFLILGVVTIRVTSH